MQDVLVAVPLMTQGAGQFELYATNQVGDTSLWIDLHSQRHDIRDATPRSDGRPRGACADRKAEHDVRVAGHSRQECCECGHYHRNCGGVPLAGKAADPLGHLGIHDLAGQRGHGRRVRLAVGQPGRLRKPRGPLSQYSRSISNLRDPGYASSASYSSRTWRAFEGGASVLATAWV